MAKSTNEVLGEYKVKGGCLSSGKMIVKSKTLIIRSPGSADKSVIPLKEVASVGTAGSNIVIETTGGKQYVVNPKGEIRSRVVDLISEAVADAKS
jgi:hypothetical protein